MRLALCTVFAVRGRTRHSNLGCVRHTEGLLLLQLQLHSNSCLQALTSSPTQPSERAGKRSGPAAALVQRTGSRCDANVMLALRST